GCRALAGTVAASLPLTPAAPAGRCRNILSPRRGGGPNRTQHHPMSYLTGTTPQPHGMGGAQTQTGAAVTIEDVFCVEGEIILYVQGGVWTQHIPETLLLVPETPNS